MSRITHPRPEVGRQRHLGITFFDGFADHDLTGQPELVESLLQHGFLIEDAEPPAKPSRGRRKAKATESPAAAEAGAQAPAEHDSVPNIEFAWNHDTIASAGGVTYTLADLHDWFDVPEDFDIWLEVDSRDVKVEEPIEIVDGQIFRTAPKHIGN